MPIDPRIPLAVGSMPVPDYANQYGNVLQLREMMRLADDRQLERDRRAEEEEQRQRMLGAFVTDPEGRIDPEATRKNIASLAPAAGLKFQQEWDTAAVTARKQKFQVKKAEQEAELAELEGFRKNVEVTAQLASAVTDAESFRRFMAQTRNFNLLTPEEIAQYTEWDTTSMAWLAQKKQQGLGLLDQIKMKQDQIARAREKTEFEQAQQTFTAEQRESDFALLGQMVPIIDSQEALDTFHEETDGRLKPLIGDVYSPGMTRSLAEMTRTPQQRATGAAAAEKLAATESAKQVAKQEKQAEHKRKRFEDLRAQHDKLFAEENDLHAANKAAGEELETIHEQILDNREGRTDEGKIVDATTHRNLQKRRTELESKITERDSQIGSLQRERATVLQRKNRVYGQPGRGGRPSPAAAATRTGKPRKATGKAATEADIRRRAIAAGIDPDILVQDAKDLRLF